MNPLSCCYISNLNVQEKKDNTVLMRNIANMTQKLFDSGYLRICVGYGNLLERMVALFTAFTTEQNPMVELLLVPTRLGDPQFDSQTDLNRYRYTLARAYQTNWMLQNDCRSDFLDYHYDLLKKHSCCVCSLDWNKAETKRILEFAEYKKMKLIHFDPNQ